MDSLVIQISVWRDGGALRARLWSDADGRTVAYAASSERELVELVNEEVARWARLGDDDGPVP